MTVLRYLTHDQVLCSNANERISGDNLTFKLSMRVPLYSGIFVEESKRELSGVQ